MIWKVARNLFLICVEFIFEMIEHFAWEIVMWARKKYHGSTLPIGTLD